MSGRVTIEDLILDEEGLATVVEAISHLRRERSEPDATDAECLVEICRDWIFETPTR